MADLSNNNGCIEARLKSQPVTAWQYQAQDANEWPACVQRCCTDCGTELLLDRRSGKQVVLLGEWLIFERDGRDPLWMTDADYRRTYAQ